ncbi:alpha/beta fold hydrolase [Amycolatopsis nigrescens]|uniref:alpha/beta fold hydrolase n=1 Tax=Amycolatopsis nigrescens TaxID=381445 RepID=UPI00037DE699|nr:alpha/beta hydrolase [Amycolatopsis nigrescens]
MTCVTSKDGTSIGYQRAGAGPAVLLVGGGLDDGSENEALVPELARNFTVFNYARRGRGDSGDTLPYAVAREIEDIDALISEAGGSAHLFGASSGGALALEAAAAGLAVDRIAVYEVPYMDNDVAAEQWSEYVGRLTAALADGQRGDALELFMRLAGSSDEDIAGARASSFWPSLEALAPTLAYDAACLGDGRPPVTRLATITQPALVATGGIPDPQLGGLQPGFFDAAADAIAAALPTAERRIIEGQTHVADPKVLAGVLEQFFTP